MIARSPVALAALLAAGLHGDAPAAAQSLCTTAGGLTRLAGVREASGVAASRRTPGIIWAHNDSSGPNLFAFDDSGNPRGRVQLTGVSITDWEDIAVGPCGDGSCLYIADIGDNNRRRSRITVWRVPEPLVVDMATKPAEALALIYPDGAHDAEALFATSAGQLFLVTKDNAASTVLFRVPMSAAGQARELQPVSRLPIERVTGAAASPDGAWVAIRTRTELLFYPADDLISGRDVRPRRFDLTGLGEPQGEGVSFGPDDLVYLAGEGGRSGTLATIRCPLH